MNKVLGERIRIHRVSKSLSQENMANELDLSIGAYSNIERGKTELSVARMYRIAKILKIDPLRLLDVQAKSTNELNEAPQEYLPVQKQLNKLSEKIAEFQVVIENQRKEIDYLKEIIELLKGNKSNQKLKK